jgi:hypothetical protein
MDDAELEANYKREGMNRYENGGTPSERARGLFTVIESNFYENSKAPSVATYASHWLWANQGRYDSKVVDLLIARYPLPSRPRIQRGYSDWDSYGKPEYKIID